LLAIHMTECRLAPSLPGRLSVAAPYRSDLQSIQIPQVQRRN
jgi:hypothetical protein